MRHIYLILLAVFFAACGHQKIRLVRTNLSKKQEIVDVKKSEQSTKNTINLETSQNTRPSTPPNPTFEPEHEPSEFSREDQSVTPPNLETETKNFPEIANDTLPETSSEQAEIDQAALKAESFGTLSTIAGILNPFVLAITGVAALVLWESTIVISGLIASIVLAAFAIIFAVISLTSTYNTKKGRRASIIGLIFAIPFFIISSLLLSAALGVF